MKSHESIPDLHSKQTASSENKLGYKENFVSTAELRLSDKNTSMLRQIGKSIRK